MPVRRWPGFDAAMDQPREMHAEEGKPRVGHRVDQVAHQVLALRAQLVILAAEGHDAHLAPLARQLGYAVAVQAGAIDQEIGFEFARGGLGNPRCALPA